MRTGVGCRLGALQELQREERRVRAPERVAAHDHSSALELGVARQGSDDGARSAVLGRVERAPEAAVGSEAQVLDEHARIHRRRDDVERVVGASEDHHHRAFVALARRDRPLHGILVVGHPHCAVQRALGVRENEAAAGASDRRAATAPMEAGAKAAARGGSRSRRRS